MTLFPGRVGGSETYVRGLLRAYAGGLGPERVTVLANRHVAAAYEGLDLGRVELREVATFRPGDSMATRALALVAARLRPAAVARGTPSGIDVLHLPVTVPVPQLPVPTVVTLHDVSHLDLPAWWSPAQRSYRRWAYEGSARRADAVVVPSAFARERLVRLAGVDRERVEVIPPGLEHDTFTPAGSSDDRLLAGLRLPSRFVVYPANAWPHKNHARLLEALAHLDDPGLALVLAGAPGRGVRRVLSRARRLGLEARVRHLGHVAPAKLAVIYRRAQALVFPSLHEAFGFPPLEAMACGCPVAASMRGGLKESCGDAAVELDPEDPASIAVAIERVVGDTDLRRRLRVRGLAQAERFSWDAAAAAHVSLYHAVRASSPSRMR